jgi:prepilin-type N-terminal cleavage/methylation domain-containing protein
MQSEKLKINNRVWRSDLLISVMDFFRKKIVITRAEVGTPNSSRGFTLIEIIVSVSIFTIVMLVTMGALLTLNDSSRKAQALRTVIDNLNFAVEDMSRKIRTGDIYRCFPSDLSAGDDFTNDGVGLKTPRDCPGGLGGSAISLKTQDVDPPLPAINGKPVWVAYIFKRNEETGIGSIFQIRAPESGGVPDLPLGTEAPITSPEVDIDTMEFRVIGAQKSVSGPKTQPMVIVNISGTVNLQKEKLRTNFSLQTAISRRGTQEAD